MPINLLERIKRAKVLSSVIFIVFAIFVVLAVLGGPDKESHKKLFQAEIHDVVKDVRIGKGANLRLTVARNPEHFSVSLVYDNIMYEIDEGDSLYKDANSYLLRFRHSGKDILLTIDSSAS